MIPKIPKFLMKDEITITPHEGEGAYGPEFGDPYTEKGHFEKGFEVVTDREGKEVVASATVFLSDSNIKSLDKVEFEGETYEVIDGQVVRPLGKKHHTEAKLKSKVYEEEDNGDDDPW